MKNKLIKSILGVVSSGIKQKPAEALPLCRKCRKQPRGPREGYGVGVCRDCSIEMEARHWEMEKRRKEEEEIRHHASIVKGVVAEIMPDIIERIGVVNNERE